MSGRIHIVLCVLLMLIAINSNAQSENTNIEIQYLTAEEVNSRVKNGNATVLFFWAVWCRASELTLNTFFSDYIDALREENTEVIIVCAGGSESEISAKYRAMKLEYDTLFIYKGEHSGGNALVDKNQINKLCNSIFPEREPEYKMPIYTYSDENGNLINKEKDTSLPEVLKQANVYKENKNAKTIIVE